MFNVTLAGDHVVGKVTIQLAVAFDVFIDVLFCAVLYSTRCLGLDLGLN